MAEHDEENSPKLHLSFTPEAAQQLKGVVDKAVAGGQTANIKLQMTPEAHAAFVSQLSQPGFTAATLIKSVPEEEEELPLPEEDESEKETEPEPEAPEKSDDEEA